MNEAVIITSYKREELLFLCLEAIRRADPEVPVIVFSDRGATSDDLTDTCERFNAALRVREVHIRYGNSWNLLAACAETLQQFRPGGIVHLIEDDTLIHRRYLDWAREQLRIGFVYDVSPQPFAVVCGRIASPHVANWYEAPCASWDSECLRIALGHVVPEYHSHSRLEMQRVLDEKMFPNSRYKKGGSEQDGMFLRCIEFHKWRTCFPERPLAQHQGAWGYNRPGHARPTGSFEDRIAWCRALLKDQRRRIELFGEDITRKEMAGAIDPIDPR